MKNKNSFSEVIWKIVEEMMKDYDQVHMVIEDLPASVDNIDVWDKMFDSFISCWEGKIKDYVKEYEEKGEAGEFDDVWSKARKVWRRLEGKENNVFMDLSVRQLFSLVGSGYEDAVNIIRLATKKAKFNGEDKSKEIVMVEEIELMEDALEKGKMEKRKKAIEDYLSRHMIAKPCKRRVKEVMDALEEDHQIDFAEYNKYLDMVRAEDD